MDSLPAGSACYLSSLLEALDKAGWAYVLYHLILLNKSMCAERTYAVLKV